MSDRRDDEERRAESRRILERVSRDSDTLLLSKARDHFAAREAEGQDPAELWGRRIARVLALVFALVAILWLWSYLAGGSS